MPNWLKIALIATGGSITAIYYGFATASSP